LSLHPLLPKFKRPLSVAGSWHAGHQQRRPQSSGTTSDNISLTGPKT
jgi:hypothetical protein